MLARLDAVLEPIKAKVLDKAATLDPMSAGTDKILRRIAGQPFYNTSPLTLNAMLSDAKNIAAQLRQQFGPFLLSAFLLVGEFAGLLDHRNVASLLVSLEESSIRRYSAGQREAL